MKIAGLQKMTLLDYPGKIAATVFMAGCNFRCPYCHNADLVLDAGLVEGIPEKQVLETLSLRRGFLDGVCITGGEPLLHGDIGGFISKIKDMGFLVKLDTNGSFPGRLKQLVGDKLVDYVAMDIKSSTCGYTKAAGLDVDVLPKIDESISFLMQGKVKYEFRTTVAKDLHTEADFIEIGRWINGARKYFLQNVEDSGNLICPGMEGVERAQLEAFADIMREYVLVVGIRGI